MSSVVFDLGGRPAFVTGGGSGIGRAVAELLAAAGARVTVADLDAEAAESVAAGIVARGGGAAAVELDVTSSASCGRAAAAVHDALGPVRILVNCAGVWTIGPFGELPSEHWRRDVEVDLLGTLAVTHALLQQMRHAGGSIVNMSSAAGRVGERGLVAYSAAKAGVIGFTKALAKEVGRDGIRVNCIAPGMTRTPATASQVERLDEATVARLYPLRRLGEPDDIANAVLFLASDLSAWVTGQVLSVDGGYSTAG